jgi:hypothetical protein
MKTIDEILNTLEEKFDTDPHRKDLINFLYNNRRFEITDTRLGPCYASYVDNMLYCAWEAVDLNLVGFILNKRKDMRVMYESLARRS